MKYLWMLLLLSVLMQSKSYAQQEQNANAPFRPGGLWAGAIAGPSWMVEKAPDSLIPEIQNYYNRLRSGWHIGFESEYFINEYLGFGGKYVRFTTRQKEDSIVIEFFSNKYYFDISNEMSIHTLSPMVYGKLPLLNNKLTITGGLGPAWLLYRNLGKAIGDTAMFKGASPGISSSLRISYELIPNLTLGVQTSYIQAILKEFIQDSGGTQQQVTLKEEDYQNISRLDFSFGIFYTLHQKNFSKP